MKKLSTSSHASPSSSSTTSLDPTMCTSKSTTSGCLTAILRKILCSDGLPRDQIRELDSTLSDKDQNLKAKQNAETDTDTATATTSVTTTPGIVARLMGLESIEIPCGSRPSALLRSRSMNSVDYLGDCNGMEEVLHKRVKSTLSFREAPTFLLHESEKYLELSFEGGGGESREFKSNGRKREPGCAELKQKVRSERGELRKNKREKVCDEKGKLGKKRVSHVSSGNVGRSDGKLQEITNTLHLSKSSSEKKKCFDSEAVKLSQNMKKCKEVVVGEKQNRRKKKKKKTICHTENKMEIECKSEDSSPVSVLDFDREACGTVGLSSRRKLSPKLDNDQHLLVQSDGNLMIDERKVEAIDNNDKHEGSKKEEKNGQEYIDIWGEVCRIVEDELAESNKTHIWTNKQGDLGSISADLESEIFYHLLNELVDQLAGIH